MTTPLTGALRTLKADPFKDLPGTGLVWRVRDGRYRLLDPDSLGGVPTSRLINTTAPLTGGGALTADLTLAVSAPSGTTPGVVRASGRGPSTYMVSTQPFYDALVTVARSANIIYATRFKQRYAHTYDTFYAECTSGSAGKFAKIALYTIGSDGLPDSLIWYSAAISIAIASTVSSAFTAGTWVNTAYKTGNNLTIPVGESLYCALLADGAVNWRAIPSGEACITNGIAATSPYIQKSSAYASGYPDPAGGSWTAGAGNTANFWLRIV